MRQLAVQIRRTIGAATVLANIAALSACSSDSGSGSSDPDEIRVGVVFSVSGDIASYGVPARDGTEAMADLINESGDLGTRKLKLFFEDAKSDPAQAALAARRLILDEEVDVVVGATVSAETLAISPIVAGEHVPMLVTVSGAAVMPQGDKSWPQSFRTLTPNTAIVERQLQEAAKVGSRVGVFYQDDAYGSAMWDDVERLAPELGIEIVAVTSAPADATNLAPQATQLADADPDVIVAGMTFPEMSGAFVRAVREAGVTLPIWGDTGSATGATAEAAGDAAQGMFGLAFVDWSEPLPAQRELAEALAADGKPAPSGVQTVQGANAIYLISEAVKSISGDITGENLRDALEALCPVQGLLVAEGCYDDENHDGYGSEAVVPVTYTDGAWVSVR